MREAALVLGEVSKCSRFLYLHPACNQGKVDSLAALSAAYAEYGAECLALLIQKRRWNLDRSEYQRFFHKSTKLTSQIQKNARAHACAIALGWARACYLKLRPKFSQWVREELIRPEHCHRLRTIGARDRDIADGWIPPQALDLYWECLNWISRGPQFPKHTMRLSAMTSWLAEPHRTVLADHWITISNLKPRETIDLPLVGSPYQSSAVAYRKGVLARLHRGRWRFEAIEIEESKPPIHDPSKPSIGIDVGFNVMAVASDGRLFGAGSLAKALTLHPKIKQIRGNRSRQNLPLDSPRVTRLEQRLTDRLTAETNACAERIAKAYAGSLIVIEDLDLQGTKGSKRFGYALMGTALARKCPTRKVNPAYTSQTCVACGHISRRNRVGVKFICRSCGKKSHTDWVGAINILRRSQDQSIDRIEDLVGLKWELMRRYRAKRSGQSIAPASLARKRRRKTSPTVGPIPYCGLGPHRDKSGSDQE